TPMALMIGTGRGAQLGILIKGPEVLENTRRVDTVVLDKTGTVTTGKMSLTGVVTTEDTSEEELLRLAGALENASEHPIARAIASGARARTDLPTVQDFANVEGLGVRGTVEGNTVLEPFDVGEVLHRGQVGSPTSKGSGSEARWKEKRFSWGGPLS